jgi:hypothetical protein
MVLFRKKHQIRELERSALQRLAAGHASLNLLHGATIEYFTTFINITVMNYA